MCSAQAPCSASSLINTGSSLPDCQAAVSTLASCRVSRSTRAHLVCPSGPALAICWGSCLAGASLVRPSGPALVPCWDSWTAWASLAQHSCPSLDTCDLLGHPAGTGLAPLPPSPLFLCVLMCQGSVTSVWCHSWVLWQSPDTPVMSCFYVSVRLRVCVPCFMLECGVRMPALMSWVSVLCWGSDTPRAPCSVSLCECAVSSSLSCVLFCPPVLCFVLSHAVCVLSAACIHVVMSCVNTWLMSILISCMFMSCFAYGWWFVCWPCACFFVFFVSTWLLS